MKHIFYRGKAAELRFGVGTSGDSSESVLPIHKLERHASYWLIIYPECDGVQSGLGVAFLRKTWGNEKLHDEEKEKTSKVWEKAPGYKVISHHMHSTHSRSPCPINMNRCGVIELGQTLKPIFVPPAGRLANQGQICDHEPYSEALESGLDPCHVIKQSRIKTGKNQPREALWQFFSPSIGDQINRMRGAEVEEKVKD